MARIAICAPSRPITPDLGDRAIALAAAHGHEAVVHPQCYLEDGHFAGPDEARLAAFLACANDPAFDAVWFARGGYGAGRIAEAAIAGLGPAARRKAYLGYSDGGMMLGALYRAGIGRPVHAPMVVDLRRPGGGEDAGVRALDWLGGAADGLEPSLDERPTVAFNLTTLAMLCGTPLMPDLAGHVVQVEEICEHLYAVDRLFNHVTAQLGGIAGIRLGRVSDVPDNDRPFGAEPEDIARDWCRRRGIAFLGEAMIGHYSANRIVPFGLAPRTFGA
ncbi:LD-carboxypeptidase [Parablastomonas sp. CN1-191]|uniref:LD-carboxypeptidase n=1 Tax=Parablastomonas sp. CN1-191 TaxID=3400908 RepID=UPI003BF82BCC